MTVEQATAEVFLTAFRSLPRREQESILGRIARDRRFRQLLEDVSDRLVPEEEMARVVYDSGKRKRVTFIDKR